MPTLRISTRLSSEVSLYVMLTGFSPVGATIHVKTKVSLLDMTRQLYDIVSPGQSIPTLDAFLSRALKITEAKG